MTIAGSKFGFQSDPDDLRGFEIPKVRNWLDLGRKSMSGMETYWKLLESARPMQLELGIGNSCGLECKHCFLGYSAGSMYGELVPLERLIDISETFIKDFGTRIICLTDRDALTPHRSIPYFDRVGRLRDHFKDLKIGGVTNGLAIPLYADELEEIHLDYLDISLDGLRHEHDSIRGSGMFDKTLAGLRLAQERNLSTRVLISTTLTKFNDKSIIQLIKQLIEVEGVSWFDIGPLMAVKMQEYQLGSRDCVYFLEKLSESLNSINSKIPITVLFELCSYCAAFFPALIDSGWLVPEEIRQDRYGHLYQEIDIGNNIKIVIRPELIPDYWHHTIRVTADGYVIGGCESISQKDYPQLSVGNIKKDSVEEVVAKSLAIGSPFYRMMLAYDQSPCRDKACFVHCLGGDSLLANAVYRTYDTKDPNCIWDEYDYQNLFEEVVHVSK